MSTLEALSDILTSCSLPPSSHEGEVPFERPPIPYRKTYWFYMLWKLVQKVKKLSPRICKDLRPPTGYASPRIAISFSYVYRLYFSCGTACTIGTSTGFAPSDLSSTKISPNLATNLEKYSLHPYPRPGSAANLQIFPDAVCCSHYVLLRNQTSPAKPLKLLRFVGLVPQCCHPREFP